MKPLHKNETTKRKYFGYLRHAKGRSEGTIIKHEQALWLYEDFSNNDDFRNFDEKKAIAFKEWLANKKKAGLNQLVSASYRYDVLRSLKAFFEWLLRQKGYRNINADAVEYISPTRADATIAHASKSVDYPVQEETRVLIEHITGDTEVDRRDKALLSLFSLIGIRVGAVVTLQMRCFDREKLVLHQDPKLGTKTKSSKTIHSFLIALNHPECMTYFIDWYDHLQQCGFGPTDPIFPLGEVRNGINNNVSFRATGCVIKKFRTSTAAIRRMLVRRCREAGLRYFHPHAFRHALIAEIEKSNLTEEVKRALSQNIGHQHTGTTFGVDGYGRISEDRQIEILKAFTARGQETSIVPHMHPEDLALLAKLVTDALHQSDDNKGRSA